MAKHKKRKSDYSTGVGKKLVKKFWKEWIMFHAIIIIISAAAVLVFYNNNFVNGWGEHYKEYIPYFTSKSFYRVEIILFKANLLIKRNDWVD